MYLIGNEFEIAKIAFVTFKTTLKQLLIFNFALLIAFFTQGLKA